ncbi:MAG: hypothetical protein M3Z06_03700 [Actinomycetota bacterium]|nr:hypothetical protein [Actinomycetota bacterium]
MSTNPGGAVSGTITVGALLAAESSQRESYLETITAVIVALVLYWVAHAYAGFAGGRLKEGEPLTLEGLGQALLHELGLLAGAAMPLLALVLFDIAGASLASALTAGTFTAAAMVVVIELVAGIRAELTGRELIGQTALGALLGCLVIAVHAILH